MKIKRFVAASMREAIRMVREEQGADAVILSNRRVDGGIEVVAATDYDAALLQQTQRRTAAPGSADQDGPAAQAPAASAADARAELPQPPAPEMQQLRSEVGQMRRMLERQLAGLAWRDLSERQPERLAALRAMVDLGIETALA